MHGPRSPVRDPHRPRPLSWRVVLAALGVAVAFPALLWLVSLPPTALVAVLSVVGLVSVATHALE